MKTKRRTNLAYLHEVTGGEAEIMKEFIVMFFEQIPEFRDGMRNHLNNGEWKELGELAHKAKSSVMTFGLEDLGIRLKQLQLKTQKLIDTQTYASYVDEFELIINEAELELQEELKKL